MDKVKIDLITAHGDPKGAAEIEMDGRYFPDVIEVGRKAYSFHGFRPDGEDEIAIYREVEAVSVE